MSEGELKQRINREITHIKYDGLEIYGEADHANRLEIMQIIEEAKKEYEAIANETQPNGEPLMLPVYCFKFSKWFRKWFGDDAP